MLSLLLVASFVLPSVLGQCCLPDKMSAVIVEAGSNNPSDFLIDFTQNKFIFKPFDHTHVDFVLTDINKLKTYQMNHDGVCHIHDLGVSATTYAQCLKSADLGGSAYLGPMGTMNVDSYVILDGNVKSIMSVTKDECVPVVSFAQVAEKAVSTHFWVNVTTTADVSGLNVDIDNCTEEETAG